MDIKAITRTYYETHNLSMEVLALQSLALLGAKVSIDQMKKWSQEDGGWKRQEVTPDKRFEYMADMLWDKIREEGPTMSAKDLVSLINQYLQLSLKAPMDLNASAKPTLDEITDAVDALDKRAN